MCEAQVVTCALEVGSCAEQIACQASSLRQALWIYAYIYMHLSPSTMHMACMHMHAQHEEFGIQHVVTLQRTTSCMFHHQNTKIHITGGCMCMYKIWVLTCACCIRVRVSLLLVTNYQLCIINYQLSFISYESSSIKYQVWIISYQLWIINY